MKVYTITTIHEVGKATIKTPLNKVDFIKFLTKHLDWYSNSDSLLLKSVSFHERDQFYKFGSGKVQVKAEAKLIAMDELSDRVLINPSEKTLNVEYEIDSKKGFGSNINYFLEEISHSLN